MEVTQVSPKPGPKQRQPFDKLRRGQPKRPRKASRPLATRTLANFGVNVRPELNAQKFMHPYKHYRLVWVLGSSFWLCGEDTKRYPKVHGTGGIIEAGKALAEKLKAPFEE